MAEKTMAERIEEAYHTLIDLAGEEEKYRTKVLAISQVFNSWANDCNPPMAKDAMKKIGEILGKPF